MINKNDKIRVLEVPSELGAGTRGASLGIGALKVAAFKSGNKYYSKYKSTILFMSLRYLLKLCSKLNPIAPSGLPIPP